MPTVESLTKINPWRIFWIFQQRRPEFCQFPFKTTFSSQKILQFTLFGFTEYLTQFLPIICKHPNVHTVATSANNGSDVDGDNVINILQSFYSLTGHSSIIRYVLTHTLFMVLLCFTVTCVCVNALQCVIDLINYYVSVYLSAGGLLVNTGSVMAKCPFCRCKWLVLVLSYVYCSCIGCVSAEGRIQFKMSCIMHSVSHGSSCPEYLTSRLQSVAVSSSGDIVDQLLNAVSTDKVQRVLLLTCWPCCLQHSEDSSPLSLDRPQRRTISGWLLTSVKCFNWLGNAPVFLV